MFINPTRYRNARGRYAAAPWHHTYRPLLNKLGALTGGYALNRYFRGSSGKSAGRRYRAYHSRRPRSKMGYTRRKKAYRKRRKFTKRRGPSIKKKVNRLSAQVNADTGTMSYRSVTTSQITSPVNYQSATNLYTLNTITQIEGSPLTKLYFLDPTNPGTLLNPNISTGTYSRNIKIASSGMKLQLKNNSKGTVHMKAYMCTPKDDTDISPTTDWDNKNADSPSAGNDKTTVGTSPLDTRSIAWNYKLMKTKVFKPGDHCNIKQFVGAFNYKPARSDAITEIYQPSNKCFVIMLVVHGGVTHDATSTAAVGIGSATLDAIWTKYWKITYPAGTNLKYVYDNRTYGSLTAGGIEGLRQIPTVTAPTVTVS